MDASEFDELLAANHRRYCAPVETRLLRRGRPTTSRPDTSFDIEDPPTI
jgi:hypothetical protein